MSNYAFKQDENLTFKLPFMYLHMQICTFVFLEGGGEGLLPLTGSCCLCVCVKVHSISLRTSWPVCGHERWGIRAEASYGYWLWLSVIPSAFDGFRCKCMVTLCQPSSPQNKNRSYGSSHHKAALQGHWPRRQQPASCCVPLY